MDKETFSNYGWIVITVIVLGIMIAFAPVFGEFIMNGVQDLLDSFKATASSALNYSVSA